MPGPAGSGGPYSFLWDPSHFFGRNISVFWAKYLCFSGKVPKFAWYGKKLGKVSRKQLKRTCPENFFPKKLSPGRVGGGGDVIARKKFQEKLGIGGPETNLPRAPEKLSAALQRKVIQLWHVIVDYILRLTIFTFFIPIKIRLLAVDCYLSCICDQWELHVKLLHV